MDDLDHKILQLLAENARMPVKDIAQRVSLTSPYPAASTAWSRRVSSAGTLSCCATPTRPRGSRR